MDTSTKQFLTNFINLLMPHVRTIAERESLLFNAFVNEHQSLLNQIRFEGSAYQFTIHCTRFLLEHEPSGSLFVLLLNVLRSQVGLNEQTEIESLLSSLPLKFNEQTGTYETIGLVESGSHHWQKVTQSPFMTPQLPPQGIFGRGDFLQTIIEELALFDSTHTKVSPIALRGMGGIGKTTVLTALGRLSPLHHYFPDGIFWVSLGQEPSIRTMQDKWGKALDLDLTPERDEAACRDRLRESFHHKRCFLIVDDVWSIADGRYFDVSGPACRLIYSTRESQIAHELATRPRTIRVDLLHPESALALLNRIAPEIVALDKMGAQTLCEKLEYLPLGITLAGRMLANEADVPSRMKRLLYELIERRKHTLDLQEVSGRLGNQDETPTSVREILDLSVQRLEKTDMERFAMSAVFGGDPLTWSLEAAVSIWECSLNEAEATTSRLIQRGLVERRGERFWMHALLAEYAEEKMEALSL